MAETEAEKKAKEIAEREAQEAKEKLEAEAKIASEKAAKIIEREAELAKNLQASDNPLEDAKEILRKIEEQNKTLVENIKRAEKAGAELMIAGRAPAGVEKTKEEEAEESARKLVAGTGLEKKAGFKPAEKK